MKKIKLLSFLLLMLCIYLKSYSQPPPCFCPAPCSGNVMIEDYNNPATWTYTLSGSSTGTMSVGGSLMNYNNVTGNGCNRMHRPLPTSITGINGVRAECKVTINSGNAPGHYIMAFAKANLDPISICTAPWTLNVNEAIWVSLQAANAPTGCSCCTNPNGANPWRFYVQSKVQGGMGPSAFINLPPGTVLPATFYVRLLQHGNNACLSVFSDANFTVHIAGSPVQVPIVTGTSSYNYLHHGVMSWASACRIASMTVDNMRICDYVISCNFRESGIIDPGNENQQVLISPNPNSGIFKIKLQDTDAIIEQISISDVDFPAQWDPKLGIHVT